VPRGVGAPVLGLCLLLALCGLSTSDLRAQETAEKGWAIAIHGGAGEAEWLNMDSATAKTYREGLARALAAGTEVLKAHGSALDAVQAAVESLEDSRIFNAGRGAAFAADGTNEMDASIMNGADQKGAGVACVHATRHPIRLARTVMEKTPYVLMVASGADAFARAQGLEQQPPAFFFTEMRWREFEGVMREKHLPVPKRPAGVPAAGPPAQPEGAMLQGGFFSHQFGTVGAVARDSEGHIAAATSTGGMQGKLPGRVGDSPILGAGTYADDGGCAVSGTGVGEYFIRLSLAHSIGQLCRSGVDPQKAADRLIHEELAKLPGGEGGVIVMGRTGAPVWSNNTVGIFHARQVEGGEAEVWVK
jgi:beta-aspartyl-peptidase (threonine type)